MLPARLHAGGRKLAVAASIAGLAAAIAAGSPAAAASTFTVTPTPDPSATLNTLNAVFSRTTADAWAVGQVGEINNDEANGGLALHWDGTPWTSTPVPVTRFRNETLAGVGATAANDAWAVGGIATNQNQLPKVPLAVHWDGTAWTSVPIPTGPNPGGTGRGGLKGVVALASNDVWAVGRSPGLTAIIEHWDGTSWTLAPIPTINLGLNAIDWNGTTWSLITSPATPKNGTGLGLSALAAAGPNDLYAAGAFGRSDVTGETDAYVAHWNGTTWTQLPVAHAAFPTDGLDAVAVTPASGGGTTGSPVWGVGTSVHPGQCCGIQIDTTLAVRG